MDRESEIILRTFRDIIEELQLNIDIIAAHPHLKAEAEKTIIEARKKFRFLLPKVKKILGLT